MALVMVIFTVMVLTAGCVLSQSTTVENDESLQQQIELLQQQNFQMVQMLDHLLENQQRQFSIQLNKLNEFQTFLTNIIGM